MKIRNMVVCQMANEAGGAINLLNAGIANVIVPSFPAVVPFSVWVQSKIDKQDVGLVHRHSVSVRGEDGQIIEMPTPDGKKLPTIMQLNAEVQRQPGAGDPEGQEFANLIAPVNVYAARPGRYTFRCDLNGQTEEADVFFLQARPS